jgi:hypothetical protein
VREQVLSGPAQLGLCALGFGVRAYHARYLC